MKIVIVKNLNLTENTTDPVKNEHLIDFHLILRHYKNFIENLATDIHLILYFNCENPIL